MNGSPICQSLWRRDLARSEMIAGGAWAGAMLAVSVISVMLRKLDYLDPDTTTRVLAGANGLMMAWYGNRMPKAFVPREQARRVRRVAAWSLVVSGLIYAGLWAFAPRQVALVGGMSAVVAGMAVTFGYCLTLRGQARAA
jgi:uncharacterized membrane protein